MKKGIKITVLGLMCCAGNVFANTTNLNVTLGASFSRLSNEQYMSPVKGLINSYASNENVKNRFFYGFGAEYNFDSIAAHPITFGLGLSFYSMDRSTITGIETPGINILPSPQDTLNYEMQIENTMVLLEPKFVYTAAQLQPYVLGGLGFARNTLKNFSESTVQGSLAVPSVVPYSNHTQTKFAYEAGLGLQYILGQCKNNHAIILRIEYRYLNLGQSQLGPAFTQTTDQYITVNNTNNIVDLGITYRL